MGTASAIEDHPDGALLHLKVVPGGSRDQVLGIHGDRLRVKVSAPPEGGKANRAVIALLAKALGVPARDVVLVRGATSPQKTVQVRGVPIDTVRTAL